MAIYRQVRQSFWTDAKVVDDFTPEDRYFYLYLMTNPHTNLCGCYELSFKSASDETGYTRDTIERLIQRMAEVHKVIRYCKDTKEVLIQKWSEYNWTSSPKFCKPLREEIISVKNNEFRAFLVELFNGMYTVSIQYEYGSDTTVSVPVSVSDSVTVPESSFDNDNERIVDESLTNRKKAHKTREPAQRNIIPPNVEWVRSYCQEEGYAVDAERFCDYYTSKGWMVGKSKMKDWQASVRTWVKNDNKRGHSSGNDDLEAWAHGQN